MNTSGASGPFHNRDSVQTIQLINEPLSDSSAQISEEIHDWAVQYTTRKMPRGIVRYQAVMPHGIVRYQAVMPEGGTAEIRVFALKY